MKLFGIISVDAGQNYKINTENKSFESVEKLKYFGTALTNQNCICEEIKSMLNLGNACCNSVQNLLPSSLLSSNIMIKTYLTVILPVVLYGCET
jgi:hypothetical protein